jgi:branched-chain amino acid transport system substrate-binding protein
VKARATGRRSPWATTKRMTRLVLSTGLLIGATATVGLVTTSAPATASNSPITIAYITSVTGEGASEDGTSPGAFKARIDLQNAQGGVNGHKIIPLIIDDQTSPTAIATAVQEADSKAFAIVSQSPLFFLAAKYPQQAGVPVTGSYSDGPEWGEQPYTNMFAADVGSLNPKYPVTTLAGNFLKQHGAKVLGTYGYGISPSSSRAAIQTADSFKHAGGKVGVLDTTVPFGGVDFTSEALSAKQNHVDSLAPEMDNNSNFALAVALQQAGVKSIGLFATGYQPDVIHSPSWSALQGDYFYSLFRPWSLPNAATKQMQAAMEKYDGYSKSDFPSFSEYEAWLGADLMIKGLQLAGPNPTRAGVITALRGVKSYNANGILPQTLDFATDFGHDDAKSCSWMMQAGKSGFTAVSSQPFCGADIPGTATASAG